MSINSNEKELKNSKNLLKNKKVLFGIKNKEVVVEYLINTTIKKRQDKTLYLYPPLNFIDFSWGTVPLYRYKTTDLRLIRKIRKLFAPSGIIEIIE